MTAAQEHSATPASASDSQGQAQRAATPSSDLCPLASVLNPPMLKVALLTAGNDKHYSIGLASALVAQGIFVDFIGSDFVDGPELHNTPLVNFFDSNFLDGIAERHIRGKRSFSAELNSILTLESVERQFIRGLPRGF